MLNKMERKFGKYAIEKLTMKLMIIYAIGYILMMASSLLGSNIMSYLYLDPYQVLHGQIWRLITWILVPVYGSSGVLSFAIMAIFFYVPIGMQLERAWGDFKYNVYLISGFVFTIIGAFLLYAYCAISMPDLVVSTSAGAANVAEMGKAYYSLIISRYVTSYYVTMSIFFAFAATFPNDLVLLMFIIPIRMKYLGVLYGLYLAYDFYEGNMFSRVIMVISVLNFVLFYLTGELNNGWSGAGKRARRSSSTRQNPFGNNGSGQRRNPFGGNGQASGSSAQRQNPFGGSGTASSDGSGSNVNSYRPETGATKIMPRHKCTICGKTEMDDPNLEFRYCSKCAGSHEYCQEHLFTHVHIQ